VSVRVAARPEPVEGRAAVDLGLWLGPGIAIAAALLFSVLVVTQLGRPLMYDDANFALAARAVADTGLPFGNQGWMSERGDFSQREQWALWHPPLYIYVLGLFSKLGGWTPAMLRLPGLIGGLACAVLTYVLAARLTRGPIETKRMAGGLAAALFLLCPVTVQSALILDIDLAVLLPLTLAFLLVYFTLEAESVRWLWLAPLFSLLLWSKMTNPLPLIGVLVVWQLLRGQFMRAGLHLVGIGIGGGALFLLSWTLASRWLGFPFDMPFGVNLVQWQDSSEGARRAYTSPGAFIEGLQPTILWLGPGLIALGLAGAALRGPQLIRHWRVLKVDVLIGLLIVLAAGYVYKSAGWFPKYQIALVPLLTCLGAPLVAHAWRTRPWLVAISALVLVPAVAFVNLRVIRDQWNLQRTWSIEDTGGAWLFVLLAVGILLGLPWRAVGATALAGVFALAAGWSLGADALLARVPYSTPYWYGTTGTLDAAAWVANNVAPDQTYIAAKEIAILTPAERYVDQDNLFFYLGSGRGFPTTWAGEPVRAVVVWDREPYVASLIARDLPPSGFVETARFGDYVVYEPPAR
jgi:4-amino-4-deoxy-L-arabinose transferase-like glycosyltransferase